jgi:predicted site-specific integrase-resolvase
MAHTYSPKQFGALIGKSVATLQRWDREGILTAYRSPTNRRYYTHDQYLAYIGVVAQPAGRVVLYARVSTRTQRPDLLNQVAALAQYCQQHGIIPSDTIQDIGSGLNYHRKGFNQLFEDIEVGKVRQLIVAHKDRLVRFGFEWFAEFCARHGTELVVMNQETLSPEQEMVSDLLSIVHVFSARLYGLRSYRKELKHALGAKDSH